MMKNIKTAVSYITIMFIILIYTFFLDGKSGMVMTAFFITVPIISAVMTIIASKSITAELLCSEQYLKKNTALEYTIKIKKNNFIPAPFVSLVISASPHFKNDEENILRLSVPFRKEISVKGSLNSYISGSGYISIDNAYISDYLNIFSFRLKNISDVKSIDIVPEIHELSSAGTMFRAVADSMLIDDNEEETVSADFNASSSFPGYEHRDYQPGDSLKRINWKLSSKRNTLMVRLDESMPSVKPSVILNLSQCRGYTEENILMREHLTEACLSFVHFCTSHGVECKFYYFENGSWHMEKISSYEQLGAIALKVSSFPETCGENYIPENTGSGACIVFIQRYCAELENSIQDASQRGIEIMTAVVEKDISGERIWYVESDFHIRESGGR